MKVQISRIVLILLFFSSYGLRAQQTPTKANYHVVSSYVRSLPALSKMDNIISAKGQGHKAPPKRRGKNTFVKGKGSKGIDLLMAKQQRINAQKRTASIPPIVSFEAHKGPNLNDPTGAIGPNHYVYAFNSGFGILDRKGKVLVPEASLATLFPGEDLGDPIVLYDNFVDRFIIMQFSATPNGILIAVCKGTDPVNDGWYTYRFNTGTFPDYEKMSIWSDGYYITANKDADSPTTSQVVYALERDKMLKGEPAQMIGFPLPGIRVTSFYSPGGFHATGSTLPPVGVGHQIVYMQDDSWEGVDRDHLKIWTTKVDWANPANSTISNPQEINITAFDGVFNEGSFANIAQPGLAILPKIDALQATMLFMTNYRRFPTHNSVVMNFAVDLDGDDKRAGIRWYELRQTADGAPWTIYQEGTYINPDGHSAFCGSINMDKEGNIGLGYTIASKTQYTALRYTGRLASDPLGVMTFGENFIINGNRASNRARYGDYAQLTIDPLDDLTFWHIGEYLKGPDPKFGRRSWVAAFKIATTESDVEPPTAPTNLVASNLTGESVTLSWQPSTDNQQVIGYNIYNGSELLTVVNGTSHTLTKLTPETSYQFLVSARDIKGNISGYSNTVPVVTPKSSFCLSGLKAFPYAEGFENNLGAWTQNQDDDLDWLLNAWRTPTRGTGPNKATEGRTYLYVEASQDRKNKRSKEVKPFRRAILTSPCFDLSNAQRPVFNFQYHMFGSSKMGSLALEVSKDNGRTWEKLWKQAGNQGNQWHSASIGLSAYAGSSIQLRFNRLLGSSSRADVAIDGVTLEESQTCADGKFKLEITFAFSPQSISWEILDDMGKVVISKKYTKEDSVQFANKTITENLGELPTGAYTFKIRDADLGGFFFGGDYVLSSEVGVIARRRELFVDRSADFCVDSDFLANCNQSITAYPYNEGFENNSIGGWTQNNDDQLDWIVNEGATLTNNTGPGKAADGSFYAYVESSRHRRGYPNRRAILTSPCFDLRNTDRAEFNFKYHMYGSPDIGSLSLEISVDDGVTWSSIWSQSKSQGDEWKTVSVNLDAYLKRRIRLRFNRVTGSDWKSDVAIDAFNLSTAGECTTGDVTLSITFDNKPEEVAWNLQNSKGDTVAFQRYELKDSILRNTTVIYKFTALPTDNYTFTIEDSFANGICCGEGQGFYTLSNANGLIKLGGNYRFDESTSFCVLDNQVNTSQTTNQAGNKETETKIRTHDLTGDDVTRFSIYPNPVTNVLNIESYGETIDQIKVFSMYGKLVNVEAGRSSNNSEISVAHLPVGVYFVRIFAGDTVVTRRFVKK